MNDHPEGDIVQFQIQRDRNPQVSQKDFAKFLEGNTSYALDLYQVIRGRLANLVFSPYSMSSALAMTYAGARGDTEAQMAQTLQFRLPQPRLHAAMNDLDLRISPVTEEEWDTSAQKFRLNVVNSLWGQAGYPFLAEFQNVLMRNYGAEMRLVNFTEQPEAARKEINRWVSQETEEKIQELIPSGAINALTSLVLANAIYFKAEWLNPFQDTHTREVPFRLLDGEQVRVQMMSSSDPVSLQYGIGDGYQAVELLYAGKQASMFIIVPDLGNFHAVEAGLTPEHLPSILEGLEPCQVSMTLPKFNFSTELKLKDILKMMGMPAAFDGDQADFSGMDGRRELFISQIFHQAFVAVDEQGTEAAAATAVVMRLRGSFRPDVRMVVDRPFLFFIRDIPTNAILFIGRVLNPNQ